MDEGFLTEAQLDDLCQMVKARLGIIVSTKRRHIINFHLSKLAADRRIADGKTLLKLFNKDAKVWRDAIPVFTINETSFLRDPRQLHFIVNDWLPEYLDSGAATLRVLSAGCSSGQEVYSLAILIDQRLRDLGREDVVVELVGFDVDGKAVRHANEGVYGVADIEPLKAMDLEFYLKQKGLSGRLIPEIREQCTFHEMNLLDIETSDLGKFDLIVCRHVLVYFEEALKLRLMRQFRTRLHHGGLVVFGENESVATTKDHLTCLAGGVYKRSPNKNPSNEVLKSKKIGVMIVDDSAAAVTAIKTMLQSDKRFEVVDVAYSVDEALEKLDLSKTDVLTVDITMPGKSGLELLEHGSIKGKVPAIVVSSSSASNKDIVGRALVNGAFDYLEKGSDKNKFEYRNDLFRLVVLAYQAKLAGKIFDFPVPLNVSKNIPTSFTADCIVIGASTGGPAALRAMLADWPSHAPPLIICQHMPRNFSQPIRKGLDAVVSADVQLAADMLKLEQGGVYLLMPSVVTLLVKKNGQLQFRHSKLPQEETLTPPIDPFMESVAGVCGNNSVGVILTGMGSDGAAGMLAMKKAGAWTIIQDEKSCVVFGMPKQAIKIGAVCEVAPLKVLNERVLSASAKKKGAA